MAGFDRDFADALVAATADRADAAGLSGIVELALGKTSSLVLELVDGRVVGVAEGIEPGEANVRIPFTGAQRAAWLAGEFDLTKAYMRGDLKPEGRSGDLIAALQLLDDPAVYGALS
ncbi:MAG: SCP2 sterol-binding domain-containing protein [Acidimicrobiales bacterium]